MSYKSLKEGGFTQTDDQFIEIIIEKSYKSLEKVGGFTQTDDQSAEKAAQEGFLGFLVLMGLIFLGFMASMTRPSIEFNITEASITQFNITSNNILYYNFNVNITVRNFENRIRDFERKMDAISSYKGNQLNSVTMIPFTLGSKNAIRLEPIVFEGNSLIKLDHKQLVEYNKETQLGIYNIHFELSKYMQDCPSLKIPMISNGNMTPTFKVVKCSYKPEY
ncbi:hypothetical protein P8452_49963 [Trifolium repens]|nr:hypothetical protein P8452_49963 [Trifolium repens]